MAINIDKLKAAQERLKSHKGGGNLKMITDSERARELQKKSVEARKRNKERIESLKLFMDDFEKIGFDVGEKAPRAIDMLNHLMMKAFHDEDFEKAAELAGQLAQYQTPKKASVQQTNTDIDLKDLTDEEFEELKKELKD